MDINECSSDVCGENANCENTVGSYICMCKSGYARRNLTGCSGKNIHYCIKLPFFLQILVFNLLFLQAEYFKMVRILNFETLEVFYDQTQNKSCYFYFDKFNYLRWELNSLFLLFYTIKEKKILQDTQKAVLRGKTDSLFQKNNLTISSSQISTSVLSALMLVTLMPSVKILWDLTLVLAKRVLLEMEKHVLVRFT